MNTYAATSNEALPIINVERLRAGITAAERDALAAEIGEACRETGFFYIVGHGIPAELVARLLGAAHDFFCLPIETKMQCDAAGGAHGYEPLRAQTLEAGTPPDLKESFLMRLDQPEAGTWPDGLPGWREAMEAYASVMLDLARVVLRGMALSLDLPEDRFQSFCEDPIVTLRLLHYPEQPATPLADEKGCGAHTDWGGITFLLQDDAGGLQVQGRDHWIDATPLPDSFVVNLGDMMARWTNDRYRSTLHRVINRSGRPRYSVAFFLDGPESYEVTCLPSCLNAGERPNYPPITVGAHLNEMHRRTYGRT